MKHVGTRRLESNRLVLRPFVIKDAEAMYHNWAKDDEVCKYLTWPRHENVDITKILLTDWVANYKNPTFYMWAILLKDIDEVIGSISVVKQNEDIQLMQIGYCIGKAWWHQGITSEALRCLIFFLFHEVGVNRIESIHDTNNPNSGKVMIACGMQYEGTCKQASFNNQGICDHCIYAILAQDYKDHPLLIK